MEMFAFILCVMAVGVASITVSPNGNSPEIKMVGGMMVDVQKDFVPMTTKAPKSYEISKYEKSKPQNFNTTKLSLNERYRRLIPYMTFYYANDLATPTTEYVKSVEVEKAKIVEASSLNREPKKIAHSQYRNVPRYQSNRINQYHFGHASPTKYYKEVPVHLKQNNYISYENEDEYRRPFFKPNKLQSIPFSPATRKPYLDIPHNNDEDHIHYYLGNKDSSPKYKLVPYEQTPPVKVNNDELYDFPENSVPIQVPVQQEPVYVKPRPRPQYVYENTYVPQTSARRPPTVVSESYYEKQRPHKPATRPVIETGFRPIVQVPYSNNQVHEYNAVTSEQIPVNYKSGTHHLQVIDPDVPEDTHSSKPNYYQYTLDQPIYKPQVTNKHNLVNVLNSLQINKSIPKTITKDNVSYSLRTLLSVLNTIQAAPEHNKIEPYVHSAPKPFVSTQLVQETIRPVAPTTESAVQNAVEFSREPYLAAVNTPSQHIDEYPLGGGGSSSQRFPLHIENDDEGGTPGRPGVDYPTLTVIPPTKFDCKTQRYKGFFADPETRCQVWHYCDLNGGQASFLCPNGTIFSQAGLTCDWWFNVRCASTTQLYVLNESLYKFILPHSPKFPEDYSGPLVDKYLTLKFKEMEEQFRKNKNKKTASEKTGSEEEEDVSEESTTITEEELGDSSIDSGNNNVSEASVVVESPGASGNVERLQP